MTLLLQLPNVQGQTIRVENTSGKLGDIEDNQKFNVDNYKPGGQIIATEHEKLDEFDDSDILKHDRGPNSTIHNKTTGIEAEEAVGQVENKDPIKEESILNN